MVSYVVRFLGVSALLGSLVPTPASAQANLHPRWEIPGFDFRKDGVWRTKARTVRSTRTRLLASAQFSVLNSRPAMGTASATTVSGVLKVPAILFRFKDSPTALFTAAAYDQVLFGATPVGAAAGRPYTYRSFYNQMSNGVFDIQGTTYNYVTLDSNEVTYTGGTSTDCLQYPNPYGSSNCNGLFSPAARTRMQNGLREALTKIDATIDFSQYVTPGDNGFVPLVLFIHQAMGGECGPGGAPENHLWAHRFTVGTYTTQDNDPFNPGQKVKISDYILQSGLGGSSSCNTAEIMPIGTVAHETGHSFGLPDLYDTDGTTEGVGQWDLMSSGSFTSALSPARMGAWTLNELGWITIRSLTTTGTYAFDDGAPPPGDTAFYVRVQEPNPRGEYYLLENRQRQQSDTALIRIHCSRAGSPGCPGGLLVWHIDAARLAQSFSNDVNTGAIHGVAVVQADSFGNLDAPASGTTCGPNSTSFGCSNRGDAGDLFPGTINGTTNNTRGLVFRTNPAALKNADGSFAGFAVDSIQQLVANGTLSFRLRFGALTVVRASDPAAMIQFEGSSYTVFRDLLEEGQTYAVNFTDPQVSPGGRTRFHFGSWSDGLGQTHTYIGQLDGDTLIANVTRDFKLIATADTGGSIQADTAINLTTGEFIPEGRVVTLTATPGSLAFCGWTGDVVSSNTVLPLSMGRPYTVHAGFGIAPTITSAAARPAGIMGATHLDTLKISGGGTSKVWSIISGSLPSGLSLSASGVITGFPQQTGDFAFTARVISCGTQTAAFTLSVTAPTLTTSAVTAQLLGPTAPLTADEVRYLDFLGNNNGSFDVGDFLAWVKLTGAPPSPAVTQGLPRRKGGPQ